MLGPIAAANIVNRYADNPEFDREYLEKKITTLEKSIADGSWINATYSHLDIDMMPALVNLANNKYPDMSLNYVADVQNLRLELNEARNNGVESCRFIINMGKDGIHFAAFDYKVINNQTSVIMFDPANFKSSLPACTLAWRAEEAIHKSSIPDCHFSAVEMDIQRSKADCGMFSLALAKKIYRESDKLDSLHQANIERNLKAENKFFVFHEEGDKYLPVTFYKHTQGQTRLNEYLNAHPEAEKQIVNKKNETVFERFDNNSATVGDKIRSTSIHKKRIAELTALLKS